MRRLFSLGSRALYWLLPFALLVGIVLGGLREPRHNFKPGPVSPELAGFFALAYPSALGGLPSNNCSSGNASCSVANLATTGALPSSNDGTLTTPGGGWYFGAYNATLGGIWPRNVTPGSVNYAMVSDGTSTNLNASTTTSLQTGGSSRLSCTSSSCNSTVAFSVTSGLRINWDGATADVSAFRSATNTLQFDNEIVHIMGASASGPAALGGVADANSTGVGNVGASGPDDLITYTLPASSLTVTNRGLRIRAWGTTTNNANAKTVALVFGSQTLITKQLTASIAGFWEIEAIVLRTGTSTQDIYVKAINSGGTTVASTDGATVYSMSAFVAGTQTEASTIVIKGQSTASTSNNDIIEEGQLTEYL